jgi:spore coat protein CotH
MRLGTRLLSALTLVATAATAVAQTHDDLFDDSRLHDVHLRLSERDWQTLRTTPDREALYPADLTWNGITVRNVALRQRGFGSRTSSKPNLRVDVNRFVTGQRFVGLTAINLDNQYSDATLMRDALAMSVFARMGVAAPRQAHARLFVNGAFAGVYSVVEPVGRQFIARAFGEDEASLESGGYLYEYRWLDEYYFEYLGSGLAPYASLFRIQTRDTDALTSIYAPIEALVRAANVPQDRFVAEAGRLVDLPQMARFLAVQNCMAELDGLVGYSGINNFYLYRFRDGRPAVFIPWDADSSLSSPDMPLGYRLNTTSLAERAMRVPALAQVYVSAVAECASIIGGVSPGDARNWLRLEVDRRSALITASVAQDRFVLFDFEEHLEGVAQLREFARLRPPYLQCQVAEATATGRLATGCPVPPSPRPTPGIAGLPPDQ